MAGRSAMSYLVSATGCTVQQLRRYVNDPEVRAFKGAPKLGLPVFKLVLSGCTYTKAAKRLGVSASKVRNVAITTADVVREYHLQSGIKKEVEPITGKDLIKQLRYQHYLNLLIKLSEFKSM